MGATAERRWGRRQFVWAAAVVVVLALAVTGIVIHSMRKDRLDAGAVRQGDVRISGPTVGRTAPFRVPNAGLMVQATAGASGSTEDSDGKVRAPRGGVLVRLAWSSTGTESLVSDPVGTTPSSLAIRSQGTRVTVDRRMMPNTHERQAVVALPGDAGDVVLEVRFAGRTQSVDLRAGHRHPGAFASLYRGWSAPNGPDAALSVERAEPTDPKSVFTWHAEVRPQKVFRLPYLSTLGWAGRGREWVVVTDVGYYLNAEAAQWRSGDRRAGYAASGEPQLSVTVAGRPPVTAPRPPREAGTDDSYSAPRNGTYVFSVGSGDAVTVETVLSVGLRRSSGEASAPAKSTLRVTRTEFRPALVTIGAPA